MEIHQIFIVLSDGIQTQNVLTESQDLTQYANRMLDGPLSAFELLVDNSMLTLIQ